MKNERILSYKMSQKLSVAELQSVSAAGLTNYWTSNATYSATGMDGSIDVTIDV
jgi:hypothetical protein